MNNHESIQRLIRDASTESIDHVVQDFTRFIHDNAFEVFGQTFHSKPRPNKQANSKWFDDNCRTAKHDSST